MEDLAMALVSPRSPLVALRRPVPVPGPGEVLLEVSACGVCRTDLHILDGDLPRCARRSSRAMRWWAAWPPWVPAPRASGRASASAYPGWAEPAATAGTVRPGTRTFATRPSSRAITATAATPGTRWRTNASASRLPDAYDDAHGRAAVVRGTHRLPGLCHGAAGGAARLYGFGAAAHLIAQVAVAEGREVFAFTRPGDTRSQEFARSLGCAWAGGSDETPPAALDAALLFAR